MQRVTTTELWSMRISYTGQEPAQQNLPYCERTLKERFYRSFSLHMNNYAPQMIVPVFRSRSLIMACSRYSDFYRADT